jgi:hypothetical protein
VLCVDDVNRDKRIDVDELFTLLLEAEPELSPSPPNQDLLFAQARTYLRKYDLDKSGDLNILEFNKLIMSHPDLIGTTLLLRQYFGPADKNSDCVLDKAVFVRSNK